jgi:hypothetical protein
MKTKVDRRLLEEARRFALRFACDDCAHFDPDRQRCSLLFEAAPRRDALAVRPDSEADDGPLVELCKTFELA